VSDSEYKLPYDSVHILYTKGLGFQLSFGHQLQPMVNKFYEKSVEIANHLVQEIVRGIVRRFVCKIAHVDVPIDGTVTYFL
jgi:hypothetical protein